MENEKVINEDTIKLLRECDAGVKMGLSSLKDVLEHIKGKGLRTLTLESISTHSDCSSRIETLLTKYHDEGKDPNPMAKAMSWMKSSVMLECDESDKRVADLLTDGCNMGIKSLYGYYNQYTGANPEAKDIAMELIDAENTLVAELRKYL